MANAVTHRGRSLTGLIHKTKSGGNQMVDHPYCPFGSDGDEDDDDYGFHDEHDDPTSPNKTVDNTSDSEQHDALQLDFSDHIPLPLYMRVGKHTSESSNVEVLDTTSHDDEADDDLTTSSEASSIACFAQLFPEAHDSPPSFVPHFAPLLDDLTTSSHPDWKEDVPERRLPLTKSAKAEKPTKQPTKKKKVKKDAVDEKRKTQPPSTTTKKTARLPGTSRPIPSLAKTRASAAADWYPVLEGVGSQFTNLAFAPPKVIQCLEETAVAHRVMTKLQKHDRGNETLHPKAVLKFFLPEKSSHSPDRIILGKNGLYGPECTLSELDTSHLSSTTTASCSVLTDGVDEEEFILVHCDGSNCKSGGG